VSPLRFRGTRVINIKTLVLRPVVLGLQAVDQASLLERLDYRAAITYFTPKTR